MLICEERKDSFDGLCRCREKKERDIPKPVILSNSHISSPLTISNLSIEDTHYLSATVTHNLSIQGTHIPTIQGTYVIDMAVTKTTPIIKIKTKSTKTKTKIAKFKKENSRSGNLSESPEIYRREKGIFKNQIVFAQGNKKEKAGPYLAPQIKSILSQKISNIKSLKYKKLLVSEEQRRSRITWYCGGLKIHFLFPKRDMRVQNSLSESPAHAAFIWTKENRLDGNVLEENVAQLRESLFAELGDYVKNFKAYGFNEKLKLVLRNYKISMYLNFLITNMKTNNKIKCPFCKTNRTKRKGKKRNKHQILQKYFCNECNKFFTKNTTSPIKNKSHSPESIIKALTFYYQGYSLGQTRTIINRLNKKQTSISQSTISRWLKENYHYCTFNKLREQALKLYSPKEIIFKQRLHHNQVYLFKFHRAKLKLLESITPLEYDAFQKMNNYFQKIQTSQFPHHIFRSDKAPNQRGSNVEFPLLNPIITKQGNLSNYLARTAIQSIKNNFQRHSIIQDFMLSTDSSTIAVEIPVYLTKYDVAFLKKWNINLNITEEQTPITGHIDLLQIRNNCIYILDYKPNAEKIKPLNQLTFYALALSSRLQLPLFKFRCAWFDEDNYYKFSPLRCVYRRNSERERAVKSWLEKRRIEERKNWERTKVL